MLKVIPNTDADGCSPTLVRLCDGGWCLQNVMEYHPYKPGVLEVYEI